MRSLNDTRDIPVIVISSADRAEYIERASAAGATAFLSKPIDRSELFASIDTALCRKPDLEPVCPDRAAEI
jgi:PleD family two-component response regulator